MLASFRVMDFGPPRFHAGCVQRLQTPCSSMRSKTSPVYLAAKSNAPTPSRPAAASDLRVAVRDFAALRFDPWLSFVGPMVSPPKNERLGTVAAGRVIYHFTILLPTYGAAR